MRFKRIKTLSPDSVKLTDFFRGTKPGELSVVECDSIREFGSARTTAYNVKVEPRTDGYSVKVSLDTIAQAVTVSLTE